MSFTEGIKTTYEHTDKKCKITQTLFRFIFLKIATFHKKQTKLFSMLLRNY